MIYEEKIYPQGSGVQLPRFKYSNFLHRSCVPLSEVKFKEEEVDKAMGMDNECTGMCGL